MTLTGTTITYDGSSTATVKASVNVAGKIYYGTSNSMGSTQSAAGGTTYTLATRTDAGTTTVYAAFVPTDTTNYNSLGSSTSYNKTASANVNKASNASVTVAASDKTYNGSSQTLTSVSASGVSSWTLGYTTSSSSTSPTWLNANTNLIVKNAGTYYIWVKWTADSNHSNSETGKKTGKSATIAKANGSGSISMTGWTYGNAVTNPTVTSNPNNASVTYEWYPEDGLPAGTISKPGSTSDAGTYTVRAIFGETANYKSYTTSLVSFTISKRPVTFTATTQGKNYDGTALYVYNTASLTSGSLVSGHTATTFNCSGTARTDVGRNTKYLNGVTIKSGSVDVTSNYNITRKSGYIQIYGARLTFYNRGCGAYCSYKLDKYSGGKWTNNFVHCNSSTAKNATYGPFNFAPSDKIYVWPGNDGIYGESTMIVASHGITHDIYGGTMYFTDLNLDGANPVNGTNGHIEYTVPDFMVEGDDASHIYFSPTSGGFIMTGSVGIGHNENESSTNPPYNPPTYDSDAY